MIAGTRLGAYEVLAPIGAGGMGEVYKARDTRLGRTVAIKLLPAALAADPQFRERFDREAQAISRLAHPNICTLFDVGHEGAHFLVMEYLEGETLAARVAKGPLSIADASTIALQIADALDCAHSAAIVHRDLKPANVFLTRTGVKLLDFGLAKAGGVHTTGPSGGSIDVTAALTTPTPLTAQGTILGTLQYMAPEQVEGREADVRADIWAFGAILHEMLTGRPAFTAPNPASLIAAVLTHQPPLISAARQSVPRGFDALVAGCLEKDRDRRWQSIRDLRRQLAAMTTAADPASAAQASTPIPAAASASARAGRLAVAATALIAGTVAGFALSGKLNNAGPPARIVRFQIRPPADTTIPHFADTFLTFAASPDGTRVAFVAGNQLWIQSLDRGVPERVAGGAGATSPFWSPDGRSLAFFAGGQLKKSVDGGTAQNICAAGVSGRNTGAWNDAGVILFDQWGENTLMRVSDAGGAPSVVRRESADFGWPQFLPDGRHYLFVRLLDEHNGIVQTFVGSLDSSETTALPEVTSRSQYVDGHLLFRRDGALVAQRFDVRRLTLTGQPVVLSEFVSAFTSTGYAAFSASGPGLLVYQSIRPKNQLVWSNRDGRDIETIAPPRDYGALRLAPDGSMLAVTVRDPLLGTNDLWLHDFRRNIDSRLTTEPSSENAPVWSPDGKTIVYAADRKGPPHVFAREVSGSSDRQITAPSAGIQAVTGITPDGRSIVYSDTRPGTGSDVLMAPLDVSTQPVALVHSAAREAGGRPSPDGKWLAYTSNQSGRAEIYIRPFFDDETRWQISRAGGSNARWRADGKELFYQEGNTRILSVDVATAPRFEVSAPRVVLSRPAITDYDVTPDGTRFVFAVLDPEAEAGALNAVTNWTALLKKP